MDPNIKPPGLEGYTALAVQETVRQMEAAIARAVGQAVDRAIDGVVGALSPEVMRPVWISFTAFLAHSKNVERDSGIVRSFIETGLGLRIGLESSASLIPKNNGTHVRTLHIRRQIAEPSTEEEILYAEIFLDPVTHQLCYAPLRIMPESVLVEQRLGFFHPAVRGFLRALDEHYPNCGWTPNAELRRAYSRCFRLAGLANFSGQTEPTRIQESPDGGG